MDEVTVYVSVSADSLIHLHLLAAYFFFLLFVFYIF